MLLLALLAGCALHGYQPVSAALPLPANVYTTRPEKCPYSEVYVLSFEDWSKDELMSRVARVPDVLEADAIIDFRIGWRAVETTWRQCKAEDLTCWVAGSYPYLSVHTGVFTATGAVIRWECPEG